MTAKKWYPRRPLSGGFRRSFWVSPDVHLPSGRWEQKGWPPVASVESTRKALDVRKGESIRVWMGSMGCLLACRVLGFVFVLCFCCLVKHWTMLFFVRWSATQAIGKLNLLCLQRHCVTNFLALAAAPFWLHRASFALRFTLSLAGFVPSIRCTVRAE